MARVELTAEAKEDLADLDGSARQLVVKGLRKLQQSPSQRGTPLGSRQQGNLTGLRKLTVGDRQYRIVYHVTKDETVVVVWVIAEREDEHCYQLALARLETFRDRSFAGEVSQMLMSMFEE